MHLAFVTPLKKKDRTGNFFDIENNQMSQNAKLSSWAAPDIHTHCARQGMQVHEQPRQNLNFASECLFSLDGNQPAGGQHTNVC